LNGNRRPSDTFPSRSFQAHLRASLVSEEERMGMAAGEFRAWALSSLRLVADSAERQQLELRALGAGVDEIALQLDDVLYVAKAHVATGGMTSDELDLMAAVARRIGEYDRSVPGFLTEEGLLRPEWSDVRGRASVAVCRLSSLWELDS